MLSEETIDLYHKRFSVEKYSIGVLIINLLDVAQHVLLGDYAQQTSETKTRVNVLTFIVSDKLLKTSDEIFKICSKFC